MAILQTSFHKGEKQIPQACPGDAGNRPSE